MRIIVVFLSLFSLSVSGQASNFLKARALEKQRLFDSALVLYQLHIEQFPKDEKAYINRGQLFLLKGKQQAAIADFKQANKIKSDIANFQMAVAYGQLRDTFFTIAFLEKHLQSIYKLTASEIQLNSSFIYLQKTVVWKNLWAKPWYNRTDELIGEVRFLANSEDWMGVINFVNDNSRNSNQYGEILYLRAKAYYNMGNFSMALLDLNKLIESNKRESAYFQLRAEVQMALKDYKQADVDLTKAITIQPDNFELYTKRVFCKTQLKQLQDAYADACLLKDLFPNDKKILFLHANASCKADQYLTALLSVNGALAKDSMNHSYYLLRAEIYEKTSLPVQAIKDYNAALKLAPLNVEVLRARGNYYLKNNNLKSACADWLKAEKAGDILSGNLRWEYCK